MFPKQRLVNVSIIIYTRAMTSNRPIEIGSSILLEKTCVSDAIRLWNLAPLNL